MMLRVGIGVFTLRANYGLYVFLKYSTIERVFFFFFMLLVVLRDGVGLKFFYDVRFASYENYRDETFYFFFLIFEMIILFLMTRNCQRHEKYQSYEV